MTRKSDTKNRILDAAQHLMLNEGFHGVTVERLITEAGISKGSFFYHFASKDDLPAALLHRFIATQGAAIQICLATANDNPAWTPLERAEHVVDGIVEAFSIRMAGHPGCVVAAFSYQLMSEFPELREISQHALAGWEEAFTSLFEPFAQPLGQLPTAQQLAMHLMAVLQGGNVIARVENDSQAIAEAAKHFKLYLHLLSSEKSKHGVTIQS